MRVDPVQPAHILQALFSVCAPPDVLSVVATTAMEVVGSEFVGEFHEYFIGERRPQFSDSVKRATGCVAIVDCDRDPEEALATMQRLRSMGLKGLSVIALATQMEATYIVRAMRAGCNEFLTKPLDPAAIRAALLSFQSAHLGEVAVRENAGRVIAFYGAKGGVGTTTLAVHLANSLVRRHRKRVLIIDHHHELGHVALLLGLRDGQYHFDELIRNVNRLDADLLKGFVARHSSGLEVLASPDGCALDHDGTSEDIRLVMAFLRTQYDFVIIDSSMSYKDSVPAILKSSDEVYLVSTPDVAALRDLARRVEHLSLTEAIASKLRIIVNRSTSDDAVTGEQIETAVRFPVWMAVPNNYLDLVRAINAGEPVPIQHRSAFAQQIAKWSQKTVDANVARAEQPTVEKKRFGFWGIKDGQQPLRGQNA